MGQILELVVKLKWVFVGLSGLLIFALIGAFVDKANSKKFKFAEDNKPEGEIEAAPTEAPAAQEANTDAPAAPVEATPAQTTDPAVAPAQTVAPTSEQSAEQSQNVDTAAPAQSTPVDTANGENNTQTN